MKPTHETAENDVVERLLAYVNLGKVTDAEAVYALFRDPDAPQLWVRVADDGFRQLALASLRETGAAAASILENDRAQAQVMLEAFAASKVAARRTHSTTIAELVGKGVLVDAMSFDGQRLIQHPRFLSTGVEASAGYALALLYDRQRAFGDVLRRCAWDRCSRWFLGFARGEGGQRPKYCCAEHQRQADKGRAPARARRCRREAKAKAKAEAEAEAEAK